MALKDDFYSIHVASDRHLNMSYEQLKLCGMEFDFDSKIIDGKDYHQLKQDISISYQEFKDGKLTNLFFSWDMPVYLEYDDTEIISYYSDYIELRCILSGTSEVKIEDEVVTFNENEICFINSMAYHQESIQHSNCLLLNISIKREMFHEAFLDNIGGTPLQQFLRKNIYKFSDTQSYLRFTPHSEKQSELIQDYLFHIVIEARTKKLGYMDICLGYLIRLMDELSKSYEYNFSRKESEQYSDKLFESVSDYIKMNLTNIRMEMLSENFHYQPNFFNNLIKKKTGMTYSDYLTYLRIDRAKTLLESTDLNIEEIMWLIGYSNKGFFYKKFEEATGLKPAKYRNFARQKSKSQKENDLLDS